MHPGTQDHRGAPAAPVAGIPADPADIVDDDDDDAIETIRSAEIAAVRASCDALRFRCFVISIFDVVLGVLLAVSSWATYVWTVFAAMLTIIMFGIAAAHMRSQESLEHGDCCCTDPESFPRRYQNFNVVSSFLAFASFVSSVSATVSYAKLPGRDDFNLSVMGICASMFLFVCAIVGTKWSSDMRECCDLLFAPPVVVEVAAAVAVPVATTITPSLSGGGGEDGTATTAHILTGVPLSLPGGSASYGPAVHTSTVQPAPSQMYEYPTGSYTTVMPGQTPPPATSASPLGTNPGGEPGGGSWGVTSMSSSARSTSTYQPGAYSYSTNAV